MSGSGDLVERIARRVDELEQSASGAPVIVALSGGLDSCVLLHVLRFALPDPPPLVAAHFDHAMRAGSAEDARWVAGVCRAWGIPLRTARAEPAPTSEETARTARYAFFDTVRADEGARWLLTGHHADDQAETVLFRILRGTGLEGLRGIPSMRTPGVARPLLDVWREELEAYARGARLSWREDATNEHLGYARNVLRHRILPEAEESVAPGARAALVRLSAHATAQEEAWAEAMTTLLEPLDVEWQRRDDGTLAVASFTRDRVAALGSALCARVLRDVAKSLGRSLDTAATNRAVTFSASGASGRGVDLGGGLELRRELDRLVMAWPTPASTDRPVVIEGATSGDGMAVLGGRSVPVSWSAETWTVAAKHSSEGMEPREEQFAVDAVSFPLRVRARQPGDRIRLPGGSRKVKKVVLEARIPAGRRDQLPVLADCAGRVLWIPEVARSTEAEPTEGGMTLTIRIGA